MVERREPAEPGTGLEGMLHDPNQHTVSEPTVCEDFAVAWGEFTRCWSFYPPANHRVVEAKAALLTTLPEAIREAGAPADVGLEVAFSSTRYRCGKTLGDLADGSPTAFLAERIHRAALSGVAFLPHVPEASLVAFTERLLQHFTRRDLSLPFEALWKDTYPGLRLIDRRFDGFLDHTAPTAHDAIADTGERGGSHIDANHEMARLMAESPAIRSQIDRLRLLANQDAAQAGSTRAIDVLSRIIEALPNDAVGQYDQAVEVVQTVLDRLEDRLQVESARQGQPALENETLLNQLVQTTIRGILGSHAPTAAEVAEYLRGPQTTVSDTSSGSRGGRKGDETVSDSVQELWNDLDSLPPPRSGEFSPETAESPNEQLGVYLHFHTMLPEAETRGSIRDHLQRLLASAGTQRLQTLRAYLEGTSKTNESAFRRILDILRLCAQERLLCTSGFLSPESVVRSFPHLFGLFLESLRPGVEEDRADLIRVVEEIGLTRIVEAAEALIHEEGLLKPPRIRSVLDNPSGALLPLLRLALEHGDEELRAEVIGHLKGLRLREVEACLLYLWDEPAGLPLDYLLVLSNPERTQKQLDALHPRISVLICRYLSATEDRSDLDDRRKYGIQHLGTFFSPEAEALLQRILTERRMGLVHKAPKAVRDVAQIALDMGRRRSKEST